ncbi:IS3 family transposase [Brevibacillus sp. AF8]|nr:IS3 family transposase [Brevibacillus sp. AF8]MCE0453786.1 IS3 family transposase [Brevibacillus sp. AF8]
MAKKGQTFRIYTEEEKMEAVRLYETGVSSREVARRLGIPEKRQVLDWVNKVRSGEALTASRSNQAWRKGRPKTKFTSVEEELAYIKAENEYLKKRLSKSKRGVTSKKARFSIIEQMQTKYRLSWLLSFAKVSRAGYYKWRKSRETSVRRSEKEVDLKEHILSIHRLHPYYGYLRMTVALRKEGLQINHKRVYRLMKELGIRSVIRKKRRFFGRQASVVNPDRLERQFKAEAPLKKLVTDITYLRIGERFFYLSAVQDLFNNEIVAWHVSSQNDLSLVMSTVDSLCKGREMNGSVLHSDQGFQYTSRHYNKRLDEYGVLGSHSRRGNCLDNACIESFFSHLKTEMMYRCSAKSFEELNQSVETYIAFYNQSRFQKKLGDRSPIEYRKAIAA